MFLNCLMKPVNGLFKSLCKRDDAAELLKENSASVYARPNRIPVTLQSIISLDMSVTPHISTLSLDDNLLINSHCSSGSIDRRSA